eukprot:TRINITY_DN6667_c0_g1_i1.p2 TRINITY_DN6667_c0_g1~~TRINITY_DN6667_c0_g1_i1.p2  ORF type:complete len:387 (+),score=77.63 TRINITY_DN6667_c0_g1_i1:361-1521(+)
MSARFDVRIVGFGKALPGDPLGNTEALTRCNITGMTEEYIERKIGIKTRHIARGMPYRTNDRPMKDCCNSDLGARAATNALKVAGMTTADIDLLVCSTATPDHPVPSTAVFVQEKLGVQECAAMDIRSACCGWVQAFITALQYLRTGYHRTAVIVSTELCSTFGTLDQNDPNFCEEDKINAVLMGDGSGSVVLHAFDMSDAKVEPWGTEILQTSFQSIGCGKSPGMWLPAGGSSIPCSQRAIDERQHRFHHDFRSVLEHGPMLYGRAANDLLTRAGLTMEDMDVIIPHQANGSVRKIAKMMGMNPDAVFVNFDRVGNCGNASCFIAFTEFLEEQTKGGESRWKTVKEGDLMLMISAESTKWLFGGVMLRYHPFVPRSGRVSVQSKL